MTLFYFYFIVVINLGLLALHGYLWTPEKLRLFWVYLLGSGVVGLLMGTDSTAGFAKSFLGITICAVYSAAFLRFTRFHAVGLFASYARFAFYVAVFGLFFLPFQPWSRDRLVSVFLEPSSFCIVCMPAIYYYADEWQRNRRYGFRLITLCLAFALTFSSLGIIGLLFGGFLFGLRYRFGRVFVPVLLGLVSIVIYQRSEMFQARIGETLLGVTANDVTGINLSSLGVVTNIFVTRRQFEEHPILGGGLGSHVVAHERFINEIPGVALLPEEYRNLGRWDASSLLLRIISELGFVGLLATFWFLWYYFPRRSTPEERSIAMALLCYVFMKFMRSGEYFGAEQFFFLSIYTMVGVTSRLRIQTALRARLEVLQRALPMPAVALNATPAESH